MPKRKPSAQPSSESYQKEQLKNSPPPKESKPRINEIVKITPQGEEKPEFHSNVYWHSLSLVEASELDKLLADYE